MSLDDVQLHLVDDFETAEELMRWLGTRDTDQYIGVDTETTGLVQGKDYVRLAQVGGRVHGWAIPWEDWRGLFKEVIEKYMGDLVMHNAKFDHGMLRHCGVDIPTRRIKDTRVMSHILEPHMSTALKNQASRHVDPVAAGGQSVLGIAFGRQGAFDWETVPIDFGPYWQYGALDPVLTVHLCDHHFPRILTDAPKSFELESEVQWVIENMERYGAHVDVDYARSNFDAFMDYVSSSEKWVIENYGVKPGSNADIVKILQAEGFEFDKRTASGAIALDKEVLGNIVHPLAQTVLERRQKQKLAKTYLLHFFEDADKNGCIHPSINTLGARTGRMSMSDPNLQNLPRRNENNEAAIVVRNCITARPGHRLILCDFGQIEMRLLAHLSQCSGMIEAFRGDEDFFVALARQIYQDPTIGKKDPRRQTTKNGGYATIYGAGPVKFAKTAGITEAESRAFFNLWYGTYPEVKTFQKYVEQVAWQRQRDEGEPYVRSPITGRYFYADKNKIYALVNYLIQGVAGEIFKTKLLQLDAAGLGEWMVVPVHDEIILDVPEENVRDVVTTLRDVMNDETMLSVPITCSIAHGERWGMKVDWTDGDE